MKLVNKELSHILITGAREHNLKNINVEIPKKKFVVITGVSGSGKSSLAFDTLFAEGQRRYVESLSSYARQFLGMLEKPHFETIKGLSPAISIEQKSASRNPRSTVGTITEVYDYLRVLYARIGKQHCTECHKIVGKGNASEMTAQVLKQKPDSKIFILAPIVNGRKGEHREILQELQESGITRVRLNGRLTLIEEIHALEKNKKHTIEAVIDRLVLTAKEKRRIEDSIEQALKRGKGEIIVAIEGQKDIRMSEKRSCCNIAYPELDPPLFSFNSPLGMCPECHGIGVKFGMDPDKIIPNKKISIREGAIVPWKNYFLSDEKLESGSYGTAKLKAMEKQWGISLDTPWDKIPKAKQNIILYGGNKDKLTIDWNSASIKGEVSVGHEGLVHTLMRRYEQTTSEDQKKWYSKFMSESPCESCHGKKLKAEVLSVLVGGLSIHQLTELSIKEALDFLMELTLTSNEKKIAEELLKEIKSRLKFLVNVGLDYLSLSRSGPTLSGGEAQRIRLASQIGSELTGVLYILDEPSIGLHQRDNQKLIDTLTYLRDLGNTVLVVEHDEETMEAADWIIDMGPGAGHLGGYIVAEGTPAQIKKNPASPTGKFLSKKESIAIPKKRRELTQKFIRIESATENNLNNVTTAIPLGIMTAVTGVSGAGKSTLINQILYPAISNTLHKTELPIGAHKKITGLEQIDKIINIDQTPIGRTPRSNPATYTKVFDPIRDLFALLPEAKERGYQKGRFSFNVKGGRCEACEGDGVVRVEMHFLSDVYIVCEECKGKRFNESTLEIKYKGNSISDILNLSVSEALELFANHKQIKKILETLVDVGLGYIKLGQSATTLSGGEAQRMKLSRELAKTSTGRTFYILDEPTTGLHFQDVKMLLQVLSRLTDAGNSVLVIEHNIDVIKSSDWIIDIGPEGGKKGGKIIAEGRPEEVAKIKGSYTGEFLKRVLK